MLGSSQRQKWEMLINKMETYSELFFEKKKDLVCETCGEEFEEFDYEKVGYHALKFRHYTFKLKGTNLKLGIVGEKENVQKESVS